MTYRFKSKKAFTLIEILVSVSILAVLILALNRIYFSINTRNKLTREQSLVQADIEYFLRLATNNIKVAEKSNGGDCGIAANKFFKLSSNGDHLVFIKDGNCQSFFREEDFDGRGELYYNQEALSSKGINITDLKFLVEDDIATGQPIVTILVKAVPVLNLDNQIKAQTSISLSYY